ncbi:hypothetical protein [uncultured Croceitalea sp.]|uniref:hypothetical protein n=1 Tax=uncultured Croceitalea sp. TaxID=1798908 RepID=UPI00374E97B4
MKITDFSTQKYDTLFPNPHSDIPFRSSYAIQILEIEGKSNDTIRIIFGGVEKKYIGKFRDGWNLDYYGGGPVGFQFDPYKADKGEIFVSYSIQ